MPQIMVDIEADGPIPGENDYSMIAIGAIVVDRKLDKGFFGTLSPISTKYVPEALAVSGFTREETLKFDDPLYTMKRFNNWIKSNSVDRPMLIADNAGFDWMFVAWYFHHFLGENPFGYSCTSLTSLYKGCVCNIKKSFKHLRKTKHTHNPLVDAIGNAEAFLAINDQFNLRLF